MAKAAKDKALTVQPREAPLPFEPPLCPAEAPWDPLLWLMATRAGGGGVHCSVGVPPARSRHEAWDSLREGGWEDDLDPPPDAPPPADDCICLDTR
mmetsp:Transcript_75748/g.150157  ORF Transcript_75748/g.150157 Transcript_75748/m.150157 type:complete len:96 (+) Transcript_75748:337-624(+)